MYTSKYLHRSASSFVFCSKGETFIYYTSGEPNIKVSEADW